MQLTDRDQAFLDGEFGPGAQLAMNLVCDLATAMGAESLVDIASAHVDGCFYVGDSSVDFVRTLVDGGARVAVPTTLNVGSVDLLHGLLKPLVGAGEAAKELMDLYARLGCSPTWTCAPYQVQHRPNLGQHVAWGESNAIIYANSVLGARTERYGDFVDVACAITGRAPHAGLHLAENRRATVHFDATGIPEDRSADDVLFSLVGHIVGKRADGRVPVISGLPPATSDQMKALGAAAASSGSTALFHLVGSTPEAPTLDAIAAGPDIPVVALTDADLLEAWRELSTATEGELEFVCLGTPHFSLQEFVAFHHALRGRSIASNVRLVISTSRRTLEEVDAAGIYAELIKSGVEVVVDTCTYNSRVLGPMTGVVMTNSAKWAWYGPMNIGAEVIFAGLGACVDAAVTGKVPENAFC
ncbi:aconitase X catalytic domain-containing protein [Pseudarthrobacter sp. R1]|uniref:aconitase X n=1 Tax=Pseudarthrobacter sp. R1 TaxID=2944934 RepID=UPI00210E631F|nr:aconitase X catalytic domain-containing protein [Pseudarthrobacter sp. R1]MCQ6272774.1 aconitase X catalytic domain-containing protein [Pseudarthrobacter sp. R1]